MNSPLKVGIVLNYKNAEKKKDELIDINSEDYLQLAKEKEYSSFCITRKNKKCVPADVAIGLYLESQGIIVDYINPDDISVRRFKKNDIVFIVIYDLLESFHLSDKTKFLKFKHALKKSNNVYPPYTYQKFINNKCHYYKYLADKNIAVAPTHCITKYKWNTRDSESYVNKILGKVKSNNWESIITKPVYGQESKDFAKFLSKPGCSEQTGCKKQVCKSTLFCQKNRLKKYLAKNIPKYKSIIIQEYIPGFDKNNPEIRCYFIDGIYAYSIVTTSHLVETPVQEGGRYRIPKENWEYIMSFSQKIMENLPKLDLPGMYSNPILTRIDIGSGLESAKMGYFVNEVEFVPSLYIEDQDFPVVEEIAKSLIVVAGLYKQSSDLPIKVNF